MKKHIKKLGILTSGGDCGGLNAVLYGVAKAASAYNIQPFVITNGYAGLYNLDTINPVPLDFDTTDHIRTAVSGSEAGHSRVKISKINDDQKYEKIKNNLKKHEIDALIIAGGDDTGSVVIELIDHGIDCIHVPKTMDLDLQPYSVGGDSTIFRISQFLNDLRTTAITHNRVVIMEVFGRYAGHTAFRGGIGADADCILIPEIDVDYKIVYEHFKQRFTERLDGSAMNATTYSIVVAEGTKGKDGGTFADSSSGMDSFGHVRLAGAGANVKRELSELAKQDKAYWADVFTRNGIYVPNINELPEIRDMIPGHLVRCGSTTPFDVSFGKQCGGAAVMLMLEGIMGVTIAGMSNGKIKYMDIHEAIKQRFVNLDDVAFYEQLGVCFGRSASSFMPEIERVTGEIERYVS